MYDTFPFLAVNAEFRLCYANNITDSSCTTYTTPRDADEKKKKKKTSLVCFSYNYCKHDK